MFRGLVVLVLFFAANMSGAQRLLTVPDLSSLTGNGGAYLSVGPRSGWIYASGLGNRAMGVDMPGLARLNPDGGIDAYWKLTGIVSARSHAVASNGDVFALGIYNNSLVAHFGRFSGTHGGDPLARIYIAGSEPTTNQPRLDGIVGVSDQWLYFLVTEQFQSSSAGQWIGRINTDTNQIDRSWKWTVPKSQSYWSAAVTAGGAVTVVAIDYAEIAQNKRGSAVTQLDSTNSETALWTRTFPGQYAAAAADSRGRVYVLARVSYDVAEAIVVRIDSTGQIDVTWDATAASRTVSQSIQNRGMSVVGDDLFVDATTPSVLLSQSSSPGIARFDVNGFEKARWTSAKVTGGTNFIGAVGGKCFVQAGGGVQVLDVLSLRETSAFALTFGDAGTIAKTIALPDGGYVMVGNFNVIFGAQRYGNLLRIRADGTPDLAWTASVTAMSSDYISSAVLTPRGLVLSGDFARVNGTSTQSAKLVSISSGATLTWGSDGIKLAPSAVFDGDGYFYQFGYSRDSQYIERVRLSDGLKDSAWSIPLLTKIDQSPPSTLSVDAANGIWVFRRRVSDFGEPRATTELQRFNLATGAETFQSLTANSQRNVTSILSSPSYAYIGDLRYDLNLGGAVDASWTLRPVQTGYSTRGIVGRFIYFLDSETSGGPTSTPVLRRAPIIGSGAPESGFLVRLPALGGSFPAVDDIVQDKTSMTSDDAAFLLTYGNPFNPLVGGGGTRANVWATTRTTPATDKTVIEYFNRDVGRYFITGRASEQATLDALPASFQRTGMRFSAKSSEYRDVPEQPVCRFYAAPESGGSNTHFYGTGDDCPALNTVRQVRFEGFDFAAIKPTNAACPATAPNPVYRLFNNKSANNQGNHRYAVTVATKAKMIAKGWIDEGAVFCSASVTDASN